MKSRVLKILLRVVLGILIFITAYGTSIYLFSANCLFIFAFMRLGKGGFMIDKGFWVDAVGSVIVAAITQVAVQVVSVGALVAVKLLFS